MRKTMITLIALLVTGCHTSSRLPTLDGATHYSINNETTIELLRLRKEAVIAHQKQKQAEQALAQQQIECSAYSKRDPSI